MIGDRWSIGFVAGLGICAGTRAVRRRASALDDASAQ
jgi:hypothetical protein